MTLLNFYNNLFSVVSVLQMLKLRFRDVKYHVQSDIIRSQRKL